MTTDAGVTGGACLACGVEASADVLLIPCGEHARLCGLCAASTYRHFLEEQARHPRPLLAVSAERGTLEPVGDLPVPLTDAERAALATTATPRTPEDVRAALTARRLQRAHIETVVIPETVRRRRLLRARVLRPPSPKLQARLLRLAVPTLVAPLRSGVASALMRSFLTRLADRGEAGAPLEVHDVLAALFAPELRDPAINESAADPALDGKFIKLIRETFSRLRDVDPVAAVGSSMAGYRLSLILPLVNSKGPVKQSFHIRVLVTQDHSASLAIPRHRAALLALLRDGAAERALLSRVKLEHLAPFDRVLRRIVDETKPNTTASAEERTVQALVLLLEELLRVLADDEKASLLCAVLDLRLESAPPELTPVLSFDDWFIGAVIFRGRDADTEETVQFKRALRASPKLTFGEKLVALKLYDLTADDDAFRRKLARLVSRESLWTVGRPLREPLPAGASFRVNLERRVSDIDAYGERVERRVSDALERVLGEEREEGSFRLAGKRVIAAARAKTSPPG